MKSPLVSRPPFALPVALAIALVALAALPATAAEPVLRLKDGRPFCEAFRCDQLLPQAESFRRAEELDVPVLQALREGKVFAYLFLSKDLVSIPGYSGKALVTLIAMDPKGVILRAKVVHHNEPILLVGIPESVLEEYLSHYIGRSILDPGLLDSSRAERQKLRDAHEEGESEEGEHAVKIYMITGATVTSLVLDETLLASARDVARALGLLQAEARRTVTWHGVFAPRSWEQFLAEGSVGHLRIPAEEMALEEEHEGRAGQAGDQDGRDEEQADEEHEDQAAPGGAGEPWIDLYFGDLTLPVVGINLLGESGYAWLKESLKEGERAIFVVANGRSSFKGSGFARGGIFDRFHLKQGLNQFTFKDLDYENLYGLKAEGAPSFKESGLFYLRDARFDAARPWRFVFLASRLTGETATAKIFKTFTADYALPEQYYSVLEAAPPARRSIVEKVWRDQWPEAVGLSLFLLAVMGLFLARRWVRASARRLEAVHVTVLVVAAVYVGAVLKTPPSVTQLFPLVQSAEEGFRLDLFLSDPLLFVFWIFIAASLVLWGRGWFCGWVCPYGAVLELVHRLSRRLLPKRWLFEFPQRVHDGLRRARYVILAALVVASLYSLEWAERLAEVEPFKTTWIVGVFHREWYLALYWWALLAVSVFTFRFFCRYLCPLGAALSIGTAFRLIGIRRKEFCTRCKICARNCDSRAIDALGRINKFECLHCLECEQKYYDDRICPPLVIARRQAERLERQQVLPTAPAAPSERPASSLSAGT